MINFSQNKSFIEMLKQKEIEIKARTSSDVDSNPKFKLLLSLVASMRKLFPDNTVKYIVINSQNLNNLSDNEDNEILIKTLFCSETFASNIVIEIDNKFTVVNDSTLDSNLNDIELRQTFIDLSEQGWTILILSPDADLHYFRNGIEVGDSLFCSPDSARNYYRKKSIKDINLVFEEYRIKLADKNTYSKFFIDKSHLRSLHHDLKSDLSVEDFILQYKQLLKNKPESFFRDDLADFLKEHLNIPYIIREYQLNDDKRLDIALVDNDHLYFIEVKWIGTSVHHLGKKIGSTFTPETSIVPDAYKQCCQYISELLSTMKEKFAYAYLVVFDARELDETDSGTNMNEDKIDPELRNCFYKLKKIKDFRVKNIK